MGTATVSQIYGTIKLICLMREQRPLRWAEGALPVLPGIGRG